MNIFDLIKAATFFPTYAPGVKNWSHKMRGMNGRGNPLSFSLEDLNEINAGIDTMHKVIKKSIAHKLKHKSFIP